MRCNQVSSTIKIWGGVECTLNRVHDVYFDQLELSGHRSRISTDLERFRALGLETLRTALHSERAESEEAWATWDFTLSEMKRLGITPIAGLIHHGSGPVSTNLLDPEFPQKLAAFALEVARRFPHILDYTPVNEPQTTGRFACLYGYWYPHQCSMESYIRALYYQIKGVALSMRAIQTIQPQARLVHTEDAGATFATPVLEEFRIEREHRRWLGLDLLCGRVTSEHPLFLFLMEQGLTEVEILWFAENPCPPSIIGLNYYVTSDRFLDHRLHLYPGRAGGDTGTEPLVDVEAVRVRSEGINGIGAVLCQAWERYHLPVAIKEAHLGCEPLEQTRWLTEVWREANQQAANGVDVRAVTVWSLLGAYNWSNLCTANNGSYEAGIFDLTTGQPVPTPLADLTHRLIHGLPIDSAMAASGWWRCKERLTISPA